MSGKNKGEELAKVLLHYRLIDGLCIYQKIACPFHEDVNPSMSINLDEGRWFCFGCNLSGDALDFVKLMEHKYNGLNELEACARYLKILKSDELSDIKINVNHKAAKETSKALYTIAYDYYHGLKLNDWQAPEGQEIQEALQYMQKRGFDSETLNKCKAKVTYNRSYGLIFPMLDNGKFKGWVCRTMIKDIEARRKYLYNEGFSRATTLVGNYGSKDYVFVVEGYMDRLKFVQFGVDNVVAILGWKISNEQINKLRKAGVKRVVSALDNDVCGKKGTEYLKGYFDVVRFAYLKGVKDPGDMTKESFEKMYNKTINILRSR